MDIVTVPPEAEALCQRVAELIVAGRTGVARPLLAAARVLAPEGAPEIAILSAQLALRNGDYDTAIGPLNHALDRTPSDVRLYKCRAEVLQHLREPEAAARDAAEAVLLDRTDPEAKAILGSTLLALGRARDAVACLNEAVAAVPEAVTWRETLAAALEADADTDAALLVLTEGITRVPTNVGLRNAAMLMRMRRRDFSGAVEIADAACALGLADACTLGMKGHALACMGDHDAATVAYQEALKLGPNDPYVRHLVMAAGALPSAKRAPPEYISTVFDGYAERFESHLIALGYTVPVRMREVLMTHPAIAAGERLGPALDLGCGTGLLALAISDLPIGPITGVDLSPRMLEQARVKRLYAELRVADILSDLQRASAEQWALIAAADVLVYFGALEEVFTSIHARLNPGGWFLFSLEELQAGDASWHLHRLGRYAHAPTYVEQCLMGAGLRPLRCERKSMRQEGGEPVPGLLVLAERPCNGR